MLLKAPGVVTGRKDSVVSLVDVKDALLTGSGVLMDIARSSETQLGRVAISEDILYGPQSISIVGDSLRLTYNQANQVAQLFEMQASGWEGREISGDPTQRDRGRGLYTEILGRRGDLERIPAWDPLSVPGTDVFEQLRSLGYVQ